MAEMEITDEMVDRGARAAHDAWQTRTLGAIKRPDLGQRWERLSDRERQIWADDFRTALAAAFSTSRGTGDANV